MRPPPTPPAPAPLRLAPLRLAPLLLALAAPLATVLIAPSAARAASFDCARAAAPDERAVCADPRLSELDDLLGQANRQARAGVTPEEAPRMAVVARGILADRRECGARRGCLLAVYAGGIESYGRFGSTLPLPDWVSATEMAAGAAPESDDPPARLAACTTTRVAGIGARLEGEGPGEFSTGTSVVFANGLRQVSYSRENAVIASRPGDRVVMCLTVIPRACPPNDDRGRYYSVTNLRTRASWSLPDSQHLCGGA
ncbi:hypothetical protein VQH23_04230 [Pararoseomonas sp. SCSIO 73927]|uniref:lysozyme inhibitor LprI family protein n=1 Tax=Pararoseomonas sp. SCSIO 73927 TaxID=3114537 RepID=UPI0030D21E9D